MSRTLHYYYDLGFKKYPRNTADRGDCSYPNCLSKMRALAVLVLVAVVSPNSAPSLGQIGAHYFDTLGESQIWMNLQPEGLEHGPDPIRLNITISFHGRRLEHAPDTAELRAESIGGTFPYRIRQPILRFDLDRGIELDLTAPGRAFEFISSCQDCSLDTVIARVPFDIVRQIAASNKVLVEALGFVTRMRPANLLSLRRFVETVSDGVVIR